MNRKTQLLTTVICMTIVLFLFGTTESSAALRSDKPVADELVSSSGITFIAKMNFSQLLLTVSRPDGTVFSKTFHSGSTPYLDLSSLYGVTLAEGVYTYELRVVAANPVKIRKSVEKAGLQDNSLSGEALTQSGHFTVLGGAIVNGGPEELSRVMDVVHNDDVIVTGSICVGFDCLTDGSESFSYDTIRLKENNLRIHFDDTSAVSGYPANDWRIVANDSASGGGNYLAFEDSTADRIPFKVMAGARANALVVNNYGRIGVGTATPVLDLHIVRGDTPGVRLNQDTSSGFAAYVWDIAGNETNFFIRDVTGGSKLPFRIQPGTPTNTLTLRADGKVGIGTWAPEYKLEIEATSENAELATDRTDGATCYMSGGLNYGFFGTKTNHPLRLSVNGTWKMEINGSGHYINMSDGGYYDGTWHDSSSRAVKENIRDLALDDAVKTLDGLNPVRFYYKANKEDEHIGFIAEDVPELVATKDRNALSPMDVVAVLTKIVQEQQKFIQEQLKINAELQKRLDQLENK